MRRVLQFGLLLAIAANWCWAGDRIDGIAATVNGTPILQSDWDDEVRYEAFLNVRPVAQVTAAERQAGLQRLVDQELLRQQMGNAIAPAASSQVAERLQQLRSQYPNAQSENGWRQALGRYGLTDADIAERLASQLQIMRFVETRLRSEVHVDGPSIEAYYREKLLPQLKQAGAAELPLAQVSDRIREILVQQRLDELLTSYLRDLREHSRIRTEPDPDSRPATRDSRPHHRDWVSVGGKGR